MLLTGKKLLLTSLVLILLTKLVNACSYLPESKEQVLRKLAERDFSVKIYFYSTIFFIIANLALFFVRGRKDYWLPITMVAVGIISAPITLFAGVFDMCGDTLIKGLQINFFIFMTFLLFQLCLWADRTRLQYKKTINLQ